MGGQIVRLTGAVAGLAALGLVLAACSSTADSSGEQPSSTPKSTTPKSAEPAQSPTKRTAQPETKPVLQNPFETKGFTIRYLDQGKIKKIDVPDFEH